VAKTYLDELVEYPAKVIQKIASDKNCVGLLVNKAFATITEDDSDKVLDDFVFDFQYVDKTTQETAAYIWAELEIPDILTRQIKNTKLYVTVACHKQFMKLDHKVFPGVMGNRRDNLVRYIDKLLNFSDIFGIGPLALCSVQTIASPNEFTVKELEYTVPDFNMRELDK